MRSALTLLLVSILGVSASAQSGSLRAGAAKVDISPTSDMFPMKDALQYGSLHDPLYARALVLDNGTTKVALVGIDAIHFPPGASDPLIKSVTEELKIPADHLIISATHDHNSPAVWDQSGANGKMPYSDIVQKGVLDAVRQANANLQPARVGFGTGKAYINTNRDEKIGEGYHMGYNPEGPSDKTVAVLLVTKPSGDPIAIYANYPVHSVVMFRTHTQDGKVQVSGDLGGWASKYVEDHFPGTVALWTMASAGDQNPLFMANYNQDAPDVHDEGPGGWAILDEESRRVGEEIVRVVKDVRNTSDKAVLWGAETSVTCPGQKRAEAPQPGVPQGGFRGPAHVKMVDSDPVTIPLHLIMINDIALAGVSGEVFTEIGQHIKQDSPFDRTFVVTMLTNGVGYIPNDKAYLMPSEKAITNRLKPGCAEPAMVGGFRQLEDKYLPLWQAAQK